MIQDIKPFSMEAKRIKNVDNKTKEFITDFNTIIDPKTGKTHNLMTPGGIKVLKQYIKVYKEGVSN